MTNWNCKPKQISLPKVITLGVSCYWEIGSFLLLSLMMWSRFLWDRLRRGIWKSLEMYTRQYLQGCRQTSWAGLVGDQFRTYGDANTPIRWNENTTGPQPASIHVYSSGEFVYIFLCLETLLEVEFKINGTTSLRELRSQTAAWLLLAVFSKVDGNNCEPRQSKWVCSTCNLPRKEIKN